MKAIYNITNVLNAVIAAADACRDANLNKSNLDKLGAIATDALRLLSNAMHDAIQGNELNWEEREMIATGRHVDAIKAIRSRLGLGLKEAVDKAAAHRSAIRPGQRYDHDKGAWVENNPYSY